MFSLQKRRNQKMKKNSHRCQIVLFWIQSTLLSFFLISVSTFGSQLQVILQKHLHSDIDDHSVPKCEFQHHLKHWYLCCSWAGIMSSEYIRLFVFMVYFYRNRTFLPRSNWSQRAMLIDKEAWWWSKIEAEYVHTLSEIPSMLFINI